MPSSPGPACKQRPLSGTLSVGPAARQFQRPFGPMVVPPARASGVGLNMDEFNLSVPTGTARSDMVAELGEGVDISEAFWMSVEDDMASPFNVEDRLLLSQVFNPA